MQTINRTGSVLRDLLKSDWLPKSNSCSTSAENCPEVGSNPPSPFPQQHSALTNNTGAEQSSYQASLETVEENCPTVDPVRFGPFNPHEQLTTSNSISEEHSSIANDHQEQPMLNFDSALVSDNLFPTDRSNFSRDGMIVPAPAIISKKTCQIPARLDSSKSSKIEASLETDSIAIETVEDNYPAIASVRFGPFNPYEILQSTTSNNIGKEQTSLTKEHGEQPMLTDGRSDFYTDDPLVKATKIIVKKTCQIPTELFQSKAGACQETEQDISFIEETDSPSVPHEDLSVTSQIDYCAGPIVPAPSVIAKRTCPPPRTPKIVKAPKVMAKSTGGFFAKGKRGRSIKDHHLPAPTDSASAFATYPEREVFPMPNGQVTFTYHSKNPENGSAGNAGTSEDSNPEQGRVTRSRTGSLEHQNLNEEALFDQFGVRWLDNDNFNHSNIGQVGSNSYEVPLPPPVPEPPRDGMVICRGKWTSVGKSSKRGFVRQQGIRRHHYSPHTITGTVKETTLATLAEPDGEHQCMQCPARYNKLASLEMHIRRNHNPNLQVKCPECPKMLSCKAAIRKHLLSHRPESEWPFHCIFCFKRFQAKGDLPKHFFTYRHRHDPRIPEVGTDAWRQLLELCSVIQPGTMLPSSKKKRLRLKTTTHVGLPNSPPDLPVENGDPNASTTNLYPEVTDEIELCAEPDAPSVDEPESIVSDLNVNIDLMTSSGAHVHSSLDTISEPEVIVPESRNSLNPNLFSIQNILTTENLYQAQTILLHEFFSLNHLQITSRTQFSHRTVK